MELRQYWNVIWKRRWLVLAIVVLTALISGFVLATAPRNYQAVSRFITRQDPSAMSVGAGTTGTVGATGTTSTGAQGDTNGPSMFVYQPYGYWLGSEFLVDDYVEIVQSDAFAAAVMKATGDKLTLGKTKGTITDEDIKGALTADRKARELRVTVTGNTRDEAKVLSDAVATVLTQVKLEPLNGKLADDKPVFTQIDQATPDTIKSSTSREVINAVVRVIVGLAAALALAFLLEWLDTSVRDERDVSRVLGVPVIGSIPRV